MTPFFTSILENLGWAVLHSLWQGALVLMSVWAVRRWAGPARPHLAYTAGIIGLVVTLGGFLVTLAILMGAKAAPAQMTDAATILPPLSMPISTGASPAIDVRTLIPWLGLVWVAGFFMLSLQGMYAWAKTRCLATMGLSQPPAAWSERFSELVERAGLKRMIDLHVSALVESPVTLGTLKPIVLVPAGFLTGLPSAQVEAILLHELAHIHRHDFLIGLIQTAIRITLYFNPAVIIMSRWVSEDREQACDDFAVRKTGRSEDLVRGLATLRLSLAPQLTMAAKGNEGGPLLARLQRLTGRPMAARGLDRLSAVAISAVLIGTTVFASTSWAHPDPKSEKDETRYTLSDTTVWPGMPAPPEPPQMPDLAGLPDLPEIPPLPPIPPVPPLPFNGDEATFEARMENWGEKMEGWGERVSESFEGDFEDRMEEWGEEFGERFGEEFESRMENWGESMEAWGESIEERGDHLEALSEMSDAELRDLGLKRDDIELAGQAFGLMIADEVVMAMLPQALEAEARAEMATERAKLDPRKLADAEERIAKAMAMTRKAKQERVQDAREMAQARREEMQAERERARDESHKARHEAQKEAHERAEHMRDKAHAQRDSALEEARRAHAEVDRKAHFESSEAVKALRKQLAKDGLISGTDASFKLFISDDVMKVDNQRQSTSVRESYQSLLSKWGMEDDAEFFVKSKPGHLYFELKKDGSVTRITMNE